MKDFLGQYVTAKHYNVVVANGFSADTKLNADKTTANRNEKLTPVYIGREFDLDDEDYKVIIVALKTTNGKYVSCLESVAHINLLGKDFYVSAKDEEYGGITEEQQWQVYKTDKCDGDGITKEGDSCLLFRNVAHQTYLHSWGDNTIFYDKGRIGCSLKTPEQSTKFTGWREKSEWKFDSIEYKLDQGNLQILPSKVVGSTTNNNLEGSTPNTMDTEISFQVTSSSKFEN